IAALAFSNRRRSLSLTLIGAIFVAGVLLEKQIMPHYLAPATGLLFLFTASGLRIARLVRIGRSRIGPALVSITVAVAASLFVVRNVQRTPPNPLALRTEVTARLNASAEKHVVLVRYGKDHPFHAEFVYNGPDIDQQKIIWAFDRGPKENLALLNYYRD